MPPYRTSPSPPPAKNGPSGTRSRIRRQTRAEGLGVIWHFRSGPGCVQVDLWAHGMLSSTWARRSVDLLAAASLTVVMLGAAAISTDQPTHPVDAVVVVAVGAWVVIARRAPRTALAGSCVCFS